MSNTSVEAGTANGYEQSVCLGRGHAAHHWRQFTASLAQNDVGGGQNPPLSFLCMLAGAYVAFPRTQADADAAHDAHRPVLERYKTRNEYVNRVRIAARELERDDRLNGGRRKRADMPKIAG
jgi:hypothetical protein